MAQSHDQAASIKRFVDIGINGFRRPDLHKHLHDPYIGPAVQWTGQAADGCSDGGIDMGLGGGHLSGGKGGSIKGMFRMQYQSGIEKAAASGSGRLPVSMYRKLAAWPRALSGSTGGLSLRMRSQAAIKVDSPAIRCSALFTVCSRVSEPAFSSACVSRGVAAWSTSMGFMDRGRCLSRVKLIQDLTFGLSVHQTISDPVAGSRSCSSR